MLMIRGIKLLFSKTYRKKQFIPAASVYHKLSSSTNNVLLLPYFCCHFMFENIAYLVFPKYSDK